MIMGWRRFPALACVFLVAATTIAAAERSYTIAVVSKDKNNSWFVHMEKGIRQYGLDTGQNVFHTGPEGMYPDKQVEVVRDLVRQGVDALCVIPIDPVPLEPALKEAMDKGIVVICHEGTTVQNCHYDLEAFNNAEYGAFIMDNLARAMNGKGLYSTMVAHFTNTNHNAWANGAIEQAESKYPGLTLFESMPQLESEDSIETAYKRSKELLAASPDLKGIIGTSSKDAPGIARAIEELELVNKVFVSGTGMPNECRRSLKNGTLSYITLWDSALAGAALCSLAVKVIEGEPIENGLNLDIPGYDNLQFSKKSDRVLEGSGWMVIDASTVDDYDF